MKAIEFITEAELDIRGWGTTPYGQDIDHYGLRVQMRPSMFLKLAHPLEDESLNPYVIQHMIAGGKIAYPFLQVKIPSEWEKGDYSETPRIHGHEGRTRMKQWIKMHGDDPIQVNIITTYMRRSDITDEMISELNKGIISEYGEYVSGPLFDTSTVLESTESNYTQEAERYKDKLTKSLPWMMKFLSKTSKDYVPSEDEMLDVIEAGYNIMLQYGDVNKAGEVVRNKLKSLISKEGIEEGSNKLDFEAGDCPIFAIALHQLSGLPLYGLVEYIEEMDDWVLIHAYVKTNDGQALDVNGLTTVEHIIDTYPVSGYEEPEEVTFTEKDLLKIGYGGNKCPTLRQILPHAKKVLQSVGIDIINQQGVAEGSYREGGSITHDGVEYDFDSVMSIAEKMPTKTCSVDKLSWVLQYDTPNKERLERADITVPLIVTKSVNGKLAAIDGLHRLAKAVRDNVKTLPVKYIKPSELESAKLNKQGVAEGVTESATVTRIDSKPITDFSSNLNTYKHTDDWSQSGLDMGDNSYWSKRNIKPNTSKGLFAGDPHSTALYATGNANETRYVEYTENDQPVVYFDKKDLPAIRGRKTYLSVFDARDFRKLPSGEWFSEHPGKPIKQIPINDPFKYIESQGWKIRITNDLNKVLKKVQQLQKLGKINHYGAEGMNESKQGVAEAWSEKYKRSINCKNPKGFSQRAHCQGRKKNNEDINEEEIDEAIRHSVTPGNIPLQYRQYPVIGKGFTSLVLDAGPDKVIMLTRDDIKTEWLHHMWGLGIAKYIGNYESRHTKSKSMSELPIHILEIPKYFKLSLQNRRMISKALKDYFNIYEDILSKQPYEVRRNIHNDRRLMTRLELQALQEYNKRYNNELFEVLVDFLRNYDVSQYGVDLATRNIMQDSDGKIVVLDPIVSGALLEISKLYR